MKNIKTLIEKLTKEGKKSTAFATPKMVYKPREGHAKGKFRRYIN